MSRCDHSTKMERKVLLSDQEYYGNINIIFLMILLVKLFLGAEPVFFLGKMQWKGFLM